MIGRLAGTVAEVSEEEAVIDVGGTGWVVRCGARTLSRLPAPPELCVLHVETLWSQEQGPRLYGFFSRDERRAFTALIAIQGVGPKAALSVLDVLSPGELAGAAAREDKAAVARANGVGPKLALRIVTELKGKPLGEAVFTPAGGPVVAPAPAAPTAAGDAAAALLGLGVAEAQARRAVEQAAQRLGADAEVSALVKAALQELGR